MSVIVINYRYMFHKCLFWTIEQQFIKYNVKGFGKNFIVLNHYNLIIDTVFSVVSLMDRIINNLKKKYKNIYIMETDKDITHSLPIGYLYNYYLPEYFTRAYVKDIPKFLMYSVKVLHDYVIKTKANINKKISYVLTNEKTEEQIEQIEKWKEKAKKTNSIHLPSNVYNKRLRDEINEAVNEFDKLEGNELKINKNSLRYICPKSLLTKKTYLDNNEQIIMYYSDYFKNKFSDKWDEYSTYRTMKRLKIYPIIKTFNVHFHRYQATLKDEEIEDIYNYIVSVSKLQQLKTLPEDIKRIRIISDTKINFKSEELNKIINKEENETGNKEGNTTGNKEGNEIKISYYKIDKELNIVNKSSKSSKIATEKDFKTYSNENDIFGLLKGIKKTTLIDIIKNVSNYELFDKIIDIDTRYGINLFVDCFEIGLYSHKFDKSIIDDGTYDKRPLFKEINFISPDEYINYMSKIISLYKFNNYELI